jgi:hypothetical protein
MGAERVAVRGVDLGVARRVVRLHARVVGGADIAEISAQRVEVAHDAVPAGFEQGLSIADRRSDVGAAQDGAARMLARRRIAGAGFQPGEQSGADAASAVRWVHEPGEAGPHRSVAPDRRRQHLADGHQSAVLVLDGDGVVRGVDARVGQFLAESVRWVGLGGVVGVGHDPGERRPPR